MAHHAIKPAACANCDYAFVPGEPDEFCPRCGQQNHAVEIGFGHVAEEFMEGIFHFDSKVFSTAKLLLFRPGELTKRFLAGHRVPYVPPIRLYVFISFVFFLLLGTRLGHEKQEAEPKKSGKNAKYVVLAGPELGLTADSGALAQRREAEGRSFALRMDTIVAAALDTASPRMAQALQKARLRRKTRGSSSSLIELIKKLPANPSDAQIDSILRKNDEVPGFFNRLAARRAVRWRDSTREEVVHQALRGGSIMLFFLMPLAALLLKGAYFRQHRYYLSHLVFTVHVQCFLFLFFSVMLGLNALHRLPDWLSNVLGLLPVLYFIAALHNFYQQSWRKTVAKSLLLGVAYSLTITFCLIAVTMLGAAFF
ncbi:MAG: DUF3667 domain-containing protein [Janthinobacterium lividum]